MQQAESFDQAAMRRDAGVASSARHAEAECPGWLESAVTAVRDYANGVYPHDFTIEEARAAVQSSLPRPPELRAWGAVTKICKARGYIAPRTGVWRTAASSNGSPKQVYVARIGAAS